MPFVFINNPASFKNDTLVKWDDTFSAGASIGPGAHCPSDDGSVSVKILAPNSLTLLMQGLTWPGNFPIMEPVLTTDGNFGQMTLDLSHRIRGVGAFIQPRPRPSIVNYFPVISVNGKPELGLVSTAVNAVAFVAIQSDIQNIEEVSFNIRDSAGRSSSSIGDFGIASLFLILE